jgi:hypothetical protein
MCLSSGKSGSLPLFLAHDTGKSDLSLRVNSLGRMRIATSEDAPIFLRARATLGRC